MIRRNGFTCWARARSDNLSSGSEPYYGDLSGIDIEGQQNISIVNVSITNFNVGVVIDGSSVVVIDSNLDKNYAGIYFAYSMGEDASYGNNITNNSIGVAKAYVKGLIFYDNNFIGNQIQVYACYGNAQSDLWNGNFWSDYNGTGNTPYINNNNYQGDLGPEPLDLIDNHPLMNPYSTSMSNSSVPEFPSAIFIVAFLFVTVFVALVLQDKRKREIKDFSAICLIPE